MILTAKPRSSCPVVFALLTFMAAASACGKAADLESRVADGGFSGDTSVDQDASSDQWTGSSSTSSGTPLADASSVADTGLADGGPCSDAVFCEDFEGDDTFGGWNAATDNASIAPGPGRNSSIGLEATLDDSTASSKRALIYRDLNIEGAGRHLNVAFWFKLPEVCVPSGPLDYLLQIIVGGQVLALQENSGVTSLHRDNSPLINFTNVTKGSWHRLLLDFDRGAAMSGSSTLSASVDGLALQPGVSPLGPITSPLQLGFGIYTGNADKGCQFLVDDVIVRVHD